MTQETIHKYRPYLGELIGTFLLVFFGCGTVATSVALGANVGLFQVAILWGIGLAVAITVSAPLSGAHLNPAITIAFAILDRCDFPGRCVPFYLLAQFLGAFLAAAVLYLLFGPAIASYEAAAGIVRGAEGSEASAMIFGEFFPPPGSVPVEAVPHFQAFLAEFLGTALLAFVIFALTDDRNPFKSAKATPVLIGLTLTLLIGFFAPLSMGGFNPARDFSPRVFSMLAGWGTLPFSANGMGWLTVYILAPLLGGPAGAFAARWLAQFFVPELKGICGCGSSVTGDSC